MDSYAYDGEHPWHDDDPSDDPPRCGSRKRPRGRRRWGVPAPGSSRPVPPPLDLTIAGAPCRIHRDDGVARSLAGEAELMDYYGGGGGGIGCDGGDGVDGGEGSGTRPLLMDRYDARTLLDMLPAGRPAEEETEAAKGGGGPPHVYGTDREDGLSPGEMADANFERFGLLPEYGTVFLPKVEGGDAGGKAMEEEEEEEEEEPFQPSEEEAGQLPPSMVLPATRRHSEILRLTALRSAGAPQFEIVLKVKQAANPDFGFLLPAHRLHPYYLWLKGRSGRIAASDGKGKLAGSPPEAKAQPMSGLLAMYSSSSEGGESDDEAEAELPEDETELTATEGMTPQAAAIPDALKERRAKRLEKARMLKEHFASKMAHAGQDNG